MPRCPDGHDSSDPAYCDACGLAISGAAQAVATPVPVPEPPAPVPAATDCDNCGEPREGRFCEECGFDNELGVPAEVTASQRERAAAAQASRWTAVARPDREWFEHMRARNGPDAGTLEFPRYGPEQRFELTGSQVSIGRRSRSRGTDPDIDLGADPGISARHALLLARPDGGWDVVDLKSTNGTAVDGSDAPITPHQPVPLSDGARIRLGAWTTITLKAP